MTCYGDRWLPIARQTFPTLSFFCGNLNFRSYTNTSVNYMICLLTCSGHQYSYSNGQMTLNNNQTTSWSFIFQSLFALKHPDETNTTKIRRMLLFILFQDTYIITADLGFQVRDCATINWSSGTSHTNTVFLETEYTGFTHISLNSFLYKI